MKGTLHKNKVEGWLVLYTVEETWDRCIPIHPDYEKYYFLDDDADGKEVEFEIVQVAVDNNGTVVNYSRLIKPSVDKLGNEDVPKLGYDVDIREIALKNYPFGNAERNAFIADYNKAKEHYELVLSARELHNYKLGLIDGQKKAKETLYTEEQVIGFAEWILNSDSKKVLTRTKESLLKEYIESLKQPKKD